MGFRYVAAGPMVRSSYKAGEFFLENMIRQDRAADASALVSTFKTGAVSLFCLWSQGSDSGREVSLSSLPPSIPHRSSPSFAPSLPPFLLPSRLNSRP